MISFLISNGNEGVAFNEKLSAKNALIKNYSKK